MTHAPNEGHTNLLRERFASAFVRELARSHPDTRDLLMRRGLLSSRDEPPASFTFTLTDFAELWDGLTLSTGRTGFGIRIGSALPRETYDFFGDLLAASVTLGDALIRAVRFMPIVSPFAELEVTLQGSGALLIYRCLSPAQLHPETVELVIGSILAVARALVDNRVLGAETLVPREILFAHQAPPHAEEARALLGAPVSYGQSHSGITFDASVLHLPVHTQSTYSVARLESHARLEMTQLPEDTSFMPRLRHLLQREIRRGNPGSENLARLMGMHPKALARRLRAEQTSHREILDGLLKDLACGYLLRDDLTGHEIARLLGYADARSFQRAFVRWTGSSPDAWRRARMTLRNRRTSRPGD